MNHITKYDMTWINSRNEYYCSKYWEYLEEFDYENLGKNKCRDICLSLLTGEYEKYYNDFSNNLVNNIFLKKSYVSKNDQNSIFYIKESENMNNVEKIIKGTMEYSKNLNLIIEKIKDFSDFNNNLLTKSFYKSNKLKEIFKEKNIYNNDKYIKRKTCFDLDISEKLFDEIRNYFLHIYQRNNSDSFKKKIKDDVEKIKTNELFKNKIIHNYTYNELRHHKYNDECSIKISYLNKLMIDLTNKLIEDFSNIYFKNLSSKRNKLEKIKKEVGPS